MDNKETGKILLIAGILLFIVPFFIIPFLMIGGAEAFTCMPAISVISMIGFVLLIIGSMMMSGSNLFGHHLWGHRIPPVQYPHQAHFRQEQKPVEEINCPNCGAPPRYTDHYGICMCEFCETRYKVR